MCKSFVEGIKTPFASLVKTYEVTTKHGKKVFSYLHWAMALALADRPAQETVWTDGALSLGVFGGCVVGVREPLPGGADQVTWLPVLNGANQPIPETDATARDIGDASNRCRAKAAAMVNGIGLSLYSHGLADTTAFVRSLKLTPDSDLSQVDPAVSASPEKNGEFVDWPHALAAARITDPDFHWKVTFHEIVDKTTGEIAQKPYFRMGCGWGVGVTVTYKGTEHTEILPIMGFCEVQTKRGAKLLDHQPLVNPTCYDWNRAVMRGLVKAIAVVSGYGLSVYAKAGVSDLHVEPLTKSVPAGAQSDQTQPPVPAVMTPAPAVVDVAPAANDDEIRAQLIDKINAALKANGKDAAGLLKWLGYAGAASLSLASTVDLERGLRALSHGRRQVA